MFQAAHYALHITSLRSAEVSPAHEPLHCLGGGVRSAEVSPPRFSLGTLLVHEPLHCWARPAVDESAIVSCWRRRLQKVPPLAIGRNQCLK